MVILKMDVSLVTCSDEVAIDWHQADLPMRIEVTLKCHTGLRKS